MRKVYIVMVEHSPLPWDEAYTTTYIYNVYGTEARAKSAQRKLEADPMHEDDNVYITTRSVF
jgi:hypothetical protein